MAGHPSPDDVEQLQSQVFLAAKDNQPDVIRACLASLPPDTVKDVLHRYTNHQLSDFTPLTIAAWKGHLEVVKLLVNDFNVDLTQEIVVAGIAHNVLTCAASQGHLDIVKLLVKKGCRMSAPGENGHTPACLACRNGCLPALKYLVENGADVDGRSSGDGRTCLMVAAMTGNRECVEYLLSEGADANARDIFNRTALHWTAENNAAASDIIKLLLKHGAELSRDKDGRSPLIVAAKHRASKRVRALLQSTDVSQGERIDALELLGARYALRNINKAVRHMSQAMEERYKNPEAVVLKPHSPLPTRSDLQESHTLEELHARQADQHLLNLECLAIVSRILGFADRSTMEIFRSYFEHLRRNSQHREATAVLLHGIRNDAVGFAAETHYSIRMFSFNFASMLKEGIRTIFSDVEQVLEVILSEMDKNESLAPFFRCAHDKTWLHYLLVALCTATGQEEGERLQKLAKRFLRFDSGSAVLNAAVHSVCDKSDGFTKMAAADLPYHLLVSFLVQCEADVHARDDKRNTALHVVADSSRRKHSKPEHTDLLVEIARVLLQAGVLVGVQNTDGKTALDLAGRALAAELQACYPLSLKSLAAITVVKNRIPYTSQVPNALKEFVDKH